MALEKIIEDDKYEIVTEYKHIQINMEVVINHFTLMMILVGTIQHLVQVMMEVVVLVLTVSLVRLEVNKEHTMT